MMFPKKGPGEPTQEGREALVRLGNCGFTLPPEAESTLRNYFSSLRRIEDAINAKSPDKLWDGQWAILGLLSRGYELSVCCLDMMSSRNQNGCYAAVRGLIEAICAACWCAEATSRLTRLISLSPVNVGKMLNAGYVRHPELRRIYARVSGIVHPGRDGHLLMPKRPETGPGLFTALVMDHSNAFFKNELQLIVPLCSVFAHDIERLSITPGAIGYGELKVFRANPQDVGQ